MSQNIKYHFHRSEPSVFVEIYLPKKSLYQGKLFEVLNDGFNWEKVCKSLRDNRDEIQDFLKNSRHFKPESFCIDDILEEKLYWGYSIYEVDGVFCGGENRIFEERTQIIRFMFRPSISSISSIVKNGENELTSENPTQKETIIDMIRSAIRNPGSEKLSTAIIEKYENSENSYQDVVEYIKKWEKQIHVFLFGYILFELCEGIKIVNQSEEEIWLTSFWNLEINRVISS
jgi:hypothetical protein